mgnify:CR=1 FL=1
MTAAEFIVDGTYLAKYDEAPYLIEGFASSAAGMTSRRSAMAEAPNTTTSSAPCLSTSRMAARTSTRRRISGLGM